MKHLTKLSILAAFAFVLTLSLGSCCNKKCGDKATETQEEVLNTETEIGDISAYTFEQKDELIGKIKNQLTKLEEKIATLKTEANEAADDVKAEKEAAVAKLTQEYDALNAKLGELANATEETWENTKTGFSNMAKEANEKVEEGVEKIKDAVK